MSLKQCWPQCETLLKQTKRLVVSRHTCCFYFKVPDLVQVRCFVPLPLEEGLGTIQQVLSDSIALATKLQCQKRVDGAGGTQQRCILVCPCAYRDLFNAAFVSCWSELNEDQQDELIRSIELALTSQDIAEVTQTLLNLAEFMEHSDKVRLCPPCPDGQ